MSHDDMEHYRESLEHIVRPERPADRDDANCVRLQDYEALYLYPSLVEYAAYEADDSTEESIALGYAEHINRSVRDEGNRIVFMYAHTETARKVLFNAVDARSNHVTSLHNDVQSSIVNEIVT